MARSLADELRHLRRLKGASLRDVERETGVSNAYVSQLERGEVSSPSPHILHKLAEFYEVPYEALMRAAGYLRRQPGRKERGTRGALHAALMSAKLTEEEEERVAQFIEFLRSTRQKEP